MAESRTVWCGFGGGRKVVCNARAEMRQDSTGRLRLPEGWVHGHCDLDLEGCPGVNYCPEHKGQVYRGKSQSHWPCNYDPADDAVKEEEEPHQGFPLPTRRGTFAPMENDNDPDYGPVDN